MDRTILHVDFNYFYANVECLYHPELRNRPVAVGGDEAQRHDVVLAKTPEAKRFGVCTGESLSLARKKCPGLIVVPAHHGLYMHFSKLAHKIYERYADRIESFGLDECWIDVTENIRQTDGQNLADELRWVIQKELGITASVGVSWNKVFAKLGSDLKKPNATTIISRKTYKKKIWPLPVSALLYVGESTTQRLHNYGMNTIGELAMTPSDLLKKNLGKRGADLWTFANGMDSSPVAFFDRPKKIKSVGNSVTTYQNIATISEINRVFKILAESVSRRLQESKEYGRTIEISIRNNQLKWSAVQMTVDCPVCTTSELAHIAMYLFQNKYRFVSPVRALGIRVCNLVNRKEDSQISFNRNVIKQARQEAIDGCVGYLKKRFGKNIIKPASILNTGVPKNTDI